VHVFFIYLTVRQSQIKVGLVNHCNAFMLVLCYKNCISYFKVLCFADCCNAGGHTEVVKLLLCFGAKVEMKTKNGLTPIDFADYGTEAWKVMYTAEYGILPELPPQTDVVPVIPWNALTVSNNTDEVKTNKKKGQKDKQKKGRK